MKRKHFQFAGAHNMDWRAKNLAKAREVKKIKKDYVIKYPSGHKLNDNDKKHILHIYY